MYELGFYILEDGILHSHRCENLKAYTVSPISSCECFRLQLGRISFLMQQTTHNVFIFLWCRELISSGEVNLLSKNILCPIPSTS
jgi:hypothetical protein